MKAIKFAVLALALGCAVTQAQTREEKLEAFNKMSYEEKLQHLKETSIKGIKEQAKSTAEYLSKGGDKNKLIAAVKKKVADTLKDPDSAQFRDVSIKKYGEGFVVCGEFNAKNSYGGYVGYKKFVANADGGPNIKLIYTKVEQTDSKNHDIDAAYNAGIYDACQQK